MDTERDQASRQGVLPRDGLVIVDDGEFLLLEDLLVDLGKAKAEHASPLDQHPLNRGRMGADMLHEFSADGIEKLARLRTAIHLGQPVGTAVRTYFMGDIVRSTGEARLSAFFCQGIRCRAVHGRSLR